MIDGRNTIRISSLQANASPSPANSDWFFAYGSNMNLEQIRSRCSRSPVVATARLMNYRLDFFGYSETWDGALETVVPAPGQEVWGVVFALSRLDWERLDLWQGARMDGGGMYFHFPATVKDNDGNSHPVRLYKKDIQEAPMNPSREYLNHIVCGATENNLPSDYIDELRGRPCKDASYKVPMRGSSDLGRDAGASCADCSSGE